MCVCYCFRCVAAHSSFLYCLTAASALKKKGKHNQIFQMAKRRVKRSRAPSGHVPRTSAEQPSEQRGHAVAGGRGVNEPLPQNAMAFLQHIERMINGMRNELNGMRDELGGMRDELNGMRDELGGRIDGLRDEGKNVLVGVYESIFGAQWSYVVKDVVCVEGTLGMSVKTGEQPYCWSEEQFNVPYDPSNLWEGDKVPGVDEKLVMMVLSSQRKWPYKCFGPPAGEGSAAPIEHLLDCDVYVRRSNLRAWDIVKRELDAWMGDKCVRDPHAFVVIGTPGIGKSFGTGSLLLYQLLHYKSEKLKVVAYFVDGAAYLFHKAHREVVHYEEKGKALRDVVRMAGEGTKGCAIYDVGVDNSGMGRLPHDWCAIVLASPKKSNYEKWSSQRAGGTRHIIIDCYEEAEFRAVLSWERHVLSSKNIELKNRNDTILKDWEMVKERIHTVGPVPRYVLGSEDSFKGRASSMRNTLKSLRYADLENFLWKLESEDGWVDESATHKIVMLLRTLPGETGDCRNHIISFHMWKELLTMIFRYFCRTTLRSSVLISSEEHCAMTLEAEGLRAFTLANVVDGIVARLEYLPRKGKANDHHTSVLTRASALGRVPSTFQYFSSADRGLSLEPKQLYKPLVTNFPVVDGFFLVDAVGSSGSTKRGAGRLKRTMVMLQITKASSHHTTTSKVGKFRRFMTVVFPEWARIEKELSYELIYVQHADSSPIGERQNCSSGTEVGSGGNAAFWDAVAQFQVRLSSPVATGILQEVHGAKLRPYRGG
uniref:Uncharacterized protein TCIL3000_10_12310 n=1 Tax=Trypanosoma congolense (strain IL3000) TaxID=1068625 RepID=G0UYI2_TRYCI|nr:unnamed protein product [Trypanosoma congolense IL3000]